MTDGLARTRSVTLDGIRGHLVEVEIDVGPGLPKMVMVGLPDASLSESRDRCRAALINSGFTWPNRRITVGLSPASLPKSGPHFDLAISLGVLAATRQIPGGPLDDAMIMGELALDGRLRAVAGVLPSAVAASGAGVHRLMVPDANVAEAQVVEGLSVVGVRSLRHAIALLTGGDVPDDPPVPPLASASINPWRSDDRLAGLDLSDVRGQLEARLSVEVAAAGGHHVFLEGPPGAGKTMLAERLVGLLPDLGVEESLEVSAVHSIAGVLPADAPLLRRPPFLDPHHSSTAPSVVGGGSRVIRPGAMSLAHHGVLFMDEAPEFSTPVLEAMRQPLESGQVTIGRSNRTATFPARFQLVLAANPCPCGQSTTMGSRCDCTPAMKRRYVARISGPIRDRIDIHRVVTPLRAGSSSQAGEPSAAVAARVHEARARQRRRFAGSPWRTNGEVPGAALRLQWPIDPDVVTSVDALRRSDLSGRGVDRILRLAWTVADLAGHESPNVEDVKCAVALRTSAPLLAVPHWLGRVA